MSKLLRIKQSLLSEAKYTLAEPVIFVGFMGAGKTSVARRIARNVGLTAIDADCYFQQSLGISAGDFIREYGEAAFRVQETETLRELLSREPAIISCGGGIIETEASRELLKQHFVVYLRVNADEARSRISDMRNRPLFGDMEQARALHARREPKYQEVASLVVDTSKRSIPALANYVQVKLEERGILCPQRKSS